MRPRARSDDQHGFQAMSSCAAEAWEAIDGVEGWLSRSQSDLLCAAAASLDDGATIVEIGSFQGRSMLVLGHCAPDDANLIAIDPHAGNDRGPREIEGYGEDADDDFDRFHMNLRRAGLNERVRHLRAYSHEALGDVDGPIDLLYIDGAHRYRPALADIEQWGALVKSGGVMLIHDAFSSIGVTAAIARSLTIRTDFEFMTRSRSLALYRRRVDVDGDRSSASNLAAHLGQGPYFARNVMLKVVLALGGGRLWSVAGRTPPEWPY